MCVRERAGEYVRMRSKHYTTEWHYTHDVLWSETPQFCLVCKKTTAKPYTCVWAHLPQLYTLVFKFLESDL